MSAIQWARLIGQRVLAVLTAVAVIAVGSWAFPRHTQGPLVTSHVVIGLLAIVALLPITLLLWVAVPSPRAESSAVQRQHAHRTITLTRRQRRNVRI